MVKPSDVSPSAHYAGPPPHTGTYVTPTSHTTAPSKLDPRKVQLPAPFVVLITGGGRGLGEAYAIAYAQAGASHVILAARSGDELHAVAAKVRAENAGTRVSVVECDVCVEADVTKLRERVEEEAGGRLDVLVNNAGFLDPSGWEPITSGDATAFRRTFDVNVFGVYLVTRTLLPVLLGTEGGAKAVVGITSMSSHFASASVSMGMSKLAVNRFVEFLDAEYRERGLVAFALHPGGVRTRMSTQEGVPLPLQEFLRSDADLSAWMLVWLTRERREWLSGRYVASSWDVDELEGQREEIVKEDKFKFRMVV